MDRTGGPALNYHCSWTFASARAPPFIGVDISKATLDWAVFDGKTIVLQSQSANSEAGIKATLKLIKVLPGFKVTESVCCMEHTGIYNAHLLACLHKLSFPLCRAAGAVRKQFADQKGGRAPCGAVYNEAKPTLLMRNASPSMPFASGINCAYGNLPALFYRNWLL